ncbi:MAG: putative membrane protein insertion efficiency factor [Eubacteriales bacterium SKADARSKE-1]|nr:putative membrane protein insertion efficiency factor [Eubacteriales bacterium SKADARSKE-1]
MAKFLIKLIKFYQKNISPTKPARCRFYPTCSEYAKEAVSRFGFFKGGFLTLFRLLRCNPLFRGGFDPVPQKKVKNRK